MMTIILKRPYDQIPQEAPLMKQKISIHLRQLYLLKSLWNTDAKIVVGWHFVLVCVNVLALEEEGDRLPHKDGVL